MDKRVYEPFWDTLADRLNALLQRMPGFDWRQFRAESQAYLAAYEPPVDWQDADARSEREYFMSMERRMFDGVAYTLFEKIDAESSRSRKQAPGQEGGAP